MERSSHPRVQIEERKVGTCMDKRKRKRATAEALRRAVRKDDFRKSMASGHVAIPTDKRFEELLKRLHEAEDPEE